MNNNTITFNNNWNNKLQCKAFTTCRPHNPNKYKIGSIYDIILSDKGKKQPENKGKAIILQINNITLKEVSNGLALIDTGYNKEEFTKLVLTMYKNSNFNFDTQLFSFIFLRYTK